MPLTLNLSPALIAQAEAKAAREGRTVEQFIEQLVERELDGHPASAGNGAERMGEQVDQRSGWLYEDRDGRPLPFPVFYGGTGGPSDIDWLSNASIYAAMYEEEDERMRRWSSGESPEY